MRQRQVEDKVFFKEHGGKIMKAEVVATRPTEFPRCAPVLFLHACRLSLVCFVWMIANDISFCFCRTGVILLFFAGAMLGS